jgi:hypothetical protein
MKLNLRNGRKTAKLSNPSPERIRHERLFLLYWEYLVFNRIIREGIQSTISLYRNSGLSKERIDDEQGKNQSL